MLLNLHRLFSNITSLYVTLSSKFIMLVIADKILVKVESLSLDCYCCLDVCVVLLLTEELAI